MIAFSHAGKLPLLLLLLAGCCLVILPHGISSEVEDDDKNELEPPEFFSHYGITDDDPDERCYNITEATEFCAALLAFNKEASSSAEQSTKAASLQPRLEQVNFNDFLKSFKQAATNSTTDDWRDGLQFLEDRMLYMQEHGLFTDCVFEVGPDGDTQMFKAHRSVVASTSPVFEALLRDGADHVRVADVTPDIFRIILRFVYEGDVCLSADVPTLCDMMLTAKHLRLPRLVQLLRSSIWSNTHTENVWSTYLCALASDDEQLLQTATQIVQSRTADVLQDPDFTRIPQSALVSLLQMEELGVKEERQLIEASLRWAMAETTRQARTNDFETIREMLGPALGHLRFLALSPQEFTEIQITSNILNYTESLAILFHLSSPNSMPLPENLSSNKSPRIFINQTKYFCVVAVENFSRKCEKSRSTGLLRNDMLSIFTEFPFITNSDKLQVHGVRIPTQVLPTKLDDAAPMYNESLTVYLTHEGSVVHRHTFSALVSYNSSATIIFSEHYKCKNAEYELFIEFHRSGLYPSDPHIVKETNHVSETIDNTRYQVMYSPNSFIYSLIQKYD